MFTSSRASNHDRKGRRSSFRKTDLSSHASGFSGTTTSSVGSSGSGSTITQESASRSRRAARASASPRQNDEKAATLPVTRRQSTGSSVTKSSPTSIDVFAFLEHEPTRPQIVEPDRDSHNALTHSHDSALIREEPDLECSARSLHSDSGISIRDSSPESLHRRPSRLVLNSLQEEYPAYSLRTSSLESHQYHLNMRPVRESDSDVVVEPHSPHDQSYDVSPETFYRDHNHSSRLVAAGSVQAGSSNTRADVSGYDMLAARLTDSHNIEHTWRPLYRRFTRLNHRILLQLQDEISQMEEDLAGLDAVDARARRGSTGQIFPESRRANWQWHGSELHARRLDLLGQIYVKVEQYNQALTSFQNVMKGTTSASPSHIQQYRSWMKSNAPIAEMEQRFLDESDDLLAFCDHKSCPTCEARARLTPGLIKAVLAGLTMIITLFTGFLFLASPRMGTLLLLSVAIALYVNGDELTDAVSDYLHS